MRRVLFVLAAATGALACHPSAAAGRGEAERMVRAVDRVVAADRAEKRPGLDALAATACSEPRVCALKARCTEAFGPLVESEELTRRVHDELAAGASPERVVQLRAMADRAEAAQRDAAARLDECVNASSEVRQAYRL